MSLLTHRREWTARRSTISYTRNSTHSTLPKKKKITQQWLPTTSQAWHCRWPTISRDLWLEFTKNWDLPLFDKTTHSPPLTIHWERLFHYEGECIALFQVERFLQQTSLFLPARESEVSECNSLLLSLFQSPQSPLPLSQFGIILFAYLQSF